MLGRRVNYPVRPQDAANSLGIRNFLHEQQIRPVCMDELGKLLEFALQRLPCVLGAEDESSLQVLPVECVTVWKSAWAVVGRGVTPAEWGAK